MGQTIAIAAVFIVVLAGLGAGYISGTLGESDSPDDPRKGQQGVSATDTAVDEDSAAYPKVLCRGPGPNGSVQRLKTRPQECEFLSRAAATSSGTSAMAIGSKLDWSEWGPEGASAFGEIYTPLGGTRFGEITLAYPRVICGTLVFTGFVASLEGSPPQPDQQLTLAGCPR